MTNILYEWIDAATDGFAKSANGDCEGALEAYRLADSLCRDDADQQVIQLNPELSLLRHRVGKAEGRVVPLPPTEDRVLSLSSPDLSREEISAEGMSPTLLDIDQMEEGIRTCMDTYDPGIHAENIREELPHVLVMSTGRCGTVSLYHLFEQSNLLPYHTYFFQPANDHRREMLCRILASNWDSHLPGFVWSQMRAAEWIGACNEGRPMIGLNHLDTIFAPIFAKIHPKSRFVHLRRDPVKVFESFYRKDQWNDAQLAPVYFKFSPDLKWRKMRYSLPASIAWYVRFTEYFAEAMRRVVGEDRFIQISSDKLFAQDEEEIAKLLSFTDAGAMPGAVEHFRIPRNTKAHKAVNEISTHELTAFVLAYEGFRL